MYMVVFAQSGAISQLCGCWCQLHDQLHGHQRSQELRPQKTADG